MRWLTILLFFGVVVVQFVYPFRIIGELETPESGLLKKFEKGGGRQFEAAQAAAAGEKGDRGYISRHVEEKGAKGLHDKEGHIKEYAEVGGNKKAQKHDDGYYAQQHSAEKGEHGYQYKDEGSYAKGHNTKGHHNVHKLNEFKKRTEFFDEDNDEAHNEKHGAFEVSKAEKAGAAKKSGHLNKGFLESEFGKAGKFEKGKHYLDHKGHKKAAGQDAFYQNGAGFAKKGEDEDIKKYGFSDQY